MPPATLIDANISIYAAGREHPYRELCIRVLAAVNDDTGAFVTDAEVFRRSCTTVAGRSGGRRDRSWWKASLR